MIHVKHYLLVFLAGLVQCVKSQNPFYYIKQCHIADPNVNQCLRQSTNHLIANIQKGIPELRLDDPEPVQIDEIQLALGTGPDGYRAIFRDIEAYGVSNCTVTAVRSDIESNQFQFTLYIPKISARAQYESSGILILVRASGGGNYWGEYDMHLMYGLASCNALEAKRLYEEIFSNSIISDQKTFQRVDQRLRETEGVKVKAYLRATKVPGGDGLEYLKLQQIKMDFSVKDIRMGVDGIHNGNSVLQAALNLFINSNAQELLKEMKPHLKKKLLLLMSDFVTNIFETVPYNAFLSED